MSVRTPMERVFDAVRDGDERALQEYLPPLRERLLSLAKERLREGQRAEDVVQQTWETFWEKRDLIRDPQHVLPFLYQILRHKIGSSYLRNERQGVRERNLQDADSVPSGEFANPYLDAEANEIRHVLDRAIRRCAKEHPSWKQVLQLLGEGHSAEEIHRRLGVPAGTVHSRIHRARSRLRQILEDDFDVKL